MPAKDDCIPSRHAFSDTELERVACLCPLLPEGGVVRESLKPDPKPTSARKEGRKGVCQGGCPYKTQPQATQHLQNHAIKGPKRSAVYLRTSRWKNTLWSSVPSELYLLCRPASPHGEEVCPHHPSEKHRCLPPCSSPALPWAPATVLPSSKTHFTYEE